MALSSALLVLLLVLPETRWAGMMPGGISIARHRRKYYEKDASEQLQHGKAAEFSFGRFLSPADVKAAFDGCRSPESFKSHTGKDGRKGRVCSTHLGGDWVLAESEQVAPSCTCEQVLRAYLDSGLQKRWSPDKVIDVKTTRKAPRGSEVFYLQDLVLHSQRVIRRCTGVMRYSQRITVDKIGSDNYSAFVQLDPEQPRTPKTPFNSLSVYVGLQQAGSDVHIYAAGVFEVNRQVVPNLIVFDASGIAGDMAGKGTLWLAGHFQEKAAAAASLAESAASPWPSAAGARETTERFVQALRGRFS